MKAPIIFVQIDTCLPLACLRALWATVQGRSPFVLMPKEMGSIGRRFSLPWCMRRVSVTGHRTVLLQYETLGILGSRVLDFG